MFEPYESTERFDRNIFNGEGIKRIIKPKKTIPLLFYYMTNVIVGVIKDSLSVLVYEKFKRGDWLPIEIFLGGKSYCGWINEKDLLTV